jgi:hypothetical protein
MRRTCLVAIGLLTIGCSIDRVVQRMTPADADARSRAYLGLLVRGQLDSAIAPLLPELQRAETRAELGKIAALFRGQPLDSTRVIGVQVNTFNGTRHANLSYELHSPAGWFLANVATVDSANRWFVEGASGRTIPEPLEHTTRFTLVGRSPVHYLWLVLMLVAAGTSLGVALFVVSRRTMPRRWLWSAVALVGVGTMTLDWTSGMVGFNPITVMLLSGAVMRAGPVAPWTLSFAFPLGAVLALRRYRGWRASSATPTTDATTDGPVSEVAPPW